MIERSSRYSSDLYIVQENFTDQSDDARQTKAKIVIVPTTPWVIEGPQSGLRKMSRASRMQATITSGPTRKAASESSGFCAISEALRYRNTKELLRLNSQIQCHHFILGQNPPSTRRTSFMPTQPAHIAGNIRIMPSDTRPRLTPLSI